MPKTAEQYAQPIIDSVRDTDEGRVVELTIYKYPSMHGYFKGTSTDPLVVSGKAQAMELFEAIWDRL